MEISETLAWVYYTGNQSNLDAHKMGKWMYFFDGLDASKRAAQLCEKAVDGGLVEESKHTNDIKGVACFYLNIDDMDAHKRILSFFLENDMIQRRKNGELYNIGFKLNDQTRAGEYKVNGNFKSTLTLSQLVDMRTGEWLGDK